MRSLVILVLFGCGSSSKPTVDPAVPAADPAPCAAVATSVVRFVDAPTDQVRPLLEQHCRDDKWSVELRKCIITGETEKDLDGCDHYFVGSQRESFKRDLVKVDPNNKQPAPPPTPTDVPPSANTMPK